MNAGINYFLICMLFCLVFELPVQAQDNKAPGQFIVWLNDHPEGERHNFEGLREIRRLSHTTPIFLYEKTGENLPDEKVLKNLRSNLLVRYAQYNHAVKLRNDPNDESYNEQWNLELIDAPSAWASTTGGVTALGDTIVVAMLDSGCDLQHEDLKGNIWVNRKETPGDNIDNDNNGYIDDYFGWNAELGNDTHSPENHGTSVAGLLGARGNNEIGIAGVNWNIKIMMISGVSFESQVLEGYSYVLEARQRYNQSQGTDGAFVVATNSSFGIPYFDGGTPENHPVWCEVYNLLGAEGILSAGATINEGVNIDEVGDIPSACNSNFLITVTNTNMDDLKVSGAGYGEQTIDLGAPGEDSYSLRAFNGYGGFGGTSGATPHVTGAIALMYSIPSMEFAVDIREDPIQMATVIREAILQGVDPIPSLDGRSVTGGRINLFKSLQKLVDKYGNAYVELQITNISPNPAKNELFIEYDVFDTKEYQLRVTNTLGQIIFEKDLNPPLFGEKRERIDLGDAVAGIYFVSINSGKSIVSRSFLISQKSY